MKRDIANKNDIIIIINDFYKEVVKDSLLGEIFTEIMMVHWEKHLPRMYDFWDNQLFHTGNYAGAPFMPHININEKVQMRDEHFDRWIELFDRAVIKNFEGEKAKEMIQRAHNIREVFNYKINLINEYHHEMKH